MGCSTGFKTSDTEGVTQNQARLEARQVSPVFPLLFSHEQRRSLLHTFYCLHSREKAFIVVGAWHRIMHHYFCQKDPIPSYHASDVFTRQDCAPSIPVLPVRLGVPKPGAVSHVGGLLRTWHGLIRPTVAPTERWRQSQE